MGPISALIWEVEILQWKGNSNLLKKLELDLGGEPPISVCYKYHRSERVQIKKVVNRQ